MHRAVLALSGFFALLALCPPATADFPAARRALLAQQPRAHVVATREGDRALLVDRLALALSGDPTTAARQALLAKRDLIGLGAGDLVFERGSRHGNFRYLRYAETAAGLPVFDRFAVATLDRRDRLVRISARLAPVADRDATPGFDAATATLFATADLPTARAATAHVLGWLIYDGVARLVWRVATPAVGGHFFVSDVDARSGQLLLRRDLRR